MNSAIHDLLYNIQQKLNAPKSQFNSFGNFHFRNIEDILEGVKKLLPQGAVLTMSDDVRYIGECYYVESTATLYYQGQTLSNKGMAREQREKAKFDSSQLTGSASTYARKAALSGFFLCDDAKDADTLNKEDEPQYQEPPRPNPYLNEFTKAFMDNNYQLGLKICEKIPADQKDAFWKVLTKDQRDWVRDARAALASV